MKAISVWIRTVGLPISMIFLFTGCGGGETPEAQNFSAESQLSSATNISSTDSGTYSLTVDSKGQGSVINLAHNINCTNKVCEHFIAAGSNLTLMATAAEGFLFDHWLYQCANIGNQECQISVNTDTKVTAVFVEAGAKLSSISVAWQAPAEREDGSALTSGDIQQYVIYYRESQDLPYAGAESIDVKASGDGSIPTEIMIKNLEIGKSYYLAGITIDTNGLPSQLSNEIIKVVY